MKRAAENDERFLVDRRGEPQVIIMSLQDYIKTIAPPPKWLEQIRADARRKGVNKLTMREIDAEIKAARRARREQREKLASKNSAK
jgi:hypothetical protein